MAFDRVDFNYIWATLQAMGLGRKFLQLMKGLILDGIVKIHINGKFSDEIKLARGVHQGCPLAPMLFAISTQPLPSYIQAECLKGWLLGLQITPSLQICERLFFDEIGIHIPTSEICFQEVES